MDESQIAIIKTKGNIIGKVFEVTPTQGHKPQTQIRFTVKRSDPIFWTLPFSTNSIKHGDVLCLLQGASKPTIIRPCKSYFVIIMMAVVPLEQAEFVRPEKSLFRNFLLVWDWEYTEEFIDPDKYGLLLQTWQSDSKETSVREPMSSALRAWNDAQILGDLNEFVEAEEKERQATEIFKSAVEEKHLHSLECQCQLIPLIWALRSGYDAVPRLLLGKDGIDVDSTDSFGQGALSHAVENSDIAIVEKLLS
jgi:hypothetical protein